MSAGQDFTLMEILDLGCQSPSSVLSVELRNELLPDVVCARWILQNWANALASDGIDVNYDDGTTTASSSNDTAGGASVRRRHLQTSSSAASSSTLKTVALDLGTSAGGSSLSLVVLSPKDSLTTSLATSTATTQPPSNEAPSGTAHDLANKVLASNGLIGGLIGAIVCLGALLGMVVYRRRRRAQEQLELNAALRQRSQRGLGQVCMYR